MPTFEVDDQFFAHPKAAAAGDDALGLWVRAGSWCMCYLTDGVVPRGQATRLGLPEQWQALVVAGLVSQLEDGSYLFHDWLHWHKPASFFHELRAKASGKKRDQRARARAQSKVSPRLSPRESPRDNHRDSPRLSPGLSPPLSPVSPLPSPLPLTDPDSPLSPPAGNLTLTPTEPEPPKPRKPVKPKPVKMPLPDDWRPNGGHYELAVDEGNRNYAWVDCEASKMRDWAQAKGERSVGIDGWNARFRNWLRRALETAGPATRQPAVGTDWMATTIDAKALVAEEEAENAIGSNSGND